MSSFYHLHGFTCTLNVHIAVADAASVTVQVIMCVPISKNVPDIGLHITVPRGPVPPVTTCCENVTVDPVCPDAVVTVDGGHVKDSCAENIWNKIIIKFNLKCVLP